MENAELLRLLRTSPDEGVQAILTTYGKLIRSIITQILGKENGRDVEECASDVLFQVYRCVDQFDNSHTDSFRPYLCKIARNTAISYKRRIHGTRDVTLENELQDEFDIDNEVERRLNTATITAAIDSHRNLSEPFFSGGTTTVPVSRK